MGYYTSLQWPDQSASLGVHYNNSQVSRPSSAHQHCCAVVPAEPQPKGSVVCISARVYVCHWVPITLPDQSQHAGIITDFVFGAAGGPDPTLRFMGLDVVVYTEYTGLD